MNKIILLFFINFNFCAFTQNIKITNVKAEQEAETKPEAQKRKLCGTY